MVDPAAAYSTAGSYNEFDDAGPALKHQPFATFTQKGEFVIGVRGGEGSKRKLHPMDYDGHHISFVYAKDQDDNIICKYEFNREFDEGPVHRCQGQIPASAKQITPYQYCTSHGLWQGPTYNVHFEQGAAAFKLRGMAGEKYHDESMVVVGRPVKHEPAVTTDTTDTTGPRRYQISVRGAEGSLASLHPMVGETHHIEAVWAKDQHERVVIFEKLGATATAALSEPRPIPGGTLTLVPYEYVASTCTAVR